MLCKPTGTFCRFKIYPFTKLSNIYYNSKIIKYQDKLQNFFSVHIIVLQQAKKTKIKMPVLVPTEGRLFSMGDCGCNGCANFDFNMILWVLIIIVIITCMCND